MRHPTPALKYVIVMDDRLWCRARKRRRRRWPRVEGWYDTETGEVFVVLAGMEQHTAVHGIASTVLHETIHAASSRACEKHIANAEEAMVNWVGW